MPILLYFILAATPAVQLPPECDVPEQRDVLVLRDFAQKSGSVSVGLDSTATWCFDNAGKWTGGAKGKAAEKPEGDCAKAIAACELAKSQISEASRNMLVDTLEDLKRPYRGMAYKAKRSGLSDRPTEAADCNSRVRSELYTQAAARMDLARLASQAQNEYANYRTWLYAESLKCARNSRLSQADARRGITIDPTTGAVVDAGAPVKTVVASGNSGSPATSTATTPLAISETGIAVSRTSGSAKSADSGIAGAAGTPATSKAADSGTSAVIAGAVMLTPDGGRTLVVQGNLMTLNSVGTITGIAPNTPGTSPTGGSPVGNAPADTAAQEASLLEHWRYFAAERAKLERDGDYTSGFLNSKELRDCKCERVNPASIVKRLEAHDNVAQLLADDAKNNTCEGCLLDSFVGWKTRSAKWCRQMNTLSDYEVGVLERSDEGSGIPARCFEETRAARAAKPAVAVPAAASKPGSPGTATAPGTTTAAAGTTPGTSPNGTNPSANPGGGVPAAGTTTVSKGGFVITRTEASAAAAGQKANVDAFQAPEAYAPIPAREDNRLYVRLFMSSSCSAEIWPGPMKARTGDLMPIAYNSRQLTVKSPCGGLAEVYWGREEKPRVSEVFGRNQPLSLQFQPQ